MHVGENQYFLLFGIFYIFAASKLSCGVIGNTSDSGSEESRFDPWQDNLENSPLQSFCEGFVFCCAKKRADNQPNKSVVIPHTTQAYTECLRVIFVVHIAVFRGHDPDPGAR